MCYEILLLWGPRRETKEEKEPVLPWLRALHACMGLMMMMKRPDEMMARAAEVIDELNWGDSQPV